MKCPIQHEVADYRFGTARIGETILVRICPKCGIVFVPIIEEEVKTRNENEMMTERDKVEKGLPSEKQILKWP